MSLLNWWKTWGAPTIIWVFVFLAVGLNAANEKDIKRELDIDELRTALIYYENLHKLPASLINDSVKLIDFATDYAQDFNERKSNAFTLLPYEVDGKVQLSAYAMNIGDYVCQDMKWTSTVQHAFNRGSLSSATTIKGYKNGLVAEETLSGKYEQLYIFINTKICNGDTLLVDSIEITDTFDKQSTPTNAKH